MGKWIDRMALLALVSTAMYLLFLQAFHSIPAACVLSFVCCSLLLTLARRRPRRAGMSALQAEALLNQWACSPDEEACNSIAQLLGVRADSLIYLPGHPASTLFMRDFFEIWKNHRDRSSITIATPCRADGRAVRLLRTLPPPAVTIADAAQLIPLIRRSGLPAPEASPLRHWISRLGSAIAALPGRRSWQRRVAFGVMLLLLYLLGGNPAYLLLSVGSLLLAGVDIRQRRHA